MTSATTNATTNVTATLPPLPRVDPPRPLHLRDGPEDQLDWRLWRQEWTNYSRITKLEQHPADIQVSLFLHCAGREVLKIFNTFEYADNEDRNDLATIISKLDTFLIGELNETFERFTFNKRDQLPGETMETYISSLKSLAKQCNFCDKCRDSLIRDRIILGIRFEGHEEAKQDLLKERNLSLKKCVDICRSAESAKTHLKAMDAMGLTKEMKEIHKISQRPPAESKAQDRGTRTCRYCNRIHPFRKAECPAWGQKCTSCKGRNHFAVCCSRITDVMKHQKQKKIHGINTTDSSDEDLQHVSTIWATTNAIQDTKAAKPIYTEIELQGQRIAFQIDSGATVNLLPRRYLNTEEIKPTNIQLRMWNNSIQVPVGTCRTVIKNVKNGKKYSVEFVIVESDFTPLIGRRAAEAMKLITVNYENLAPVNVASADGDSKIPPSLEALLNKYSEVFDGTLGCLPGIIRLQVDESIQPTSSGPRRIPVALEKLVGKELDRLAALGVITPEDGPTDWVSQMAVATRKNGDIRLCIDPRPLNKALIRSHYQLPIMDEILPQLSKAKVISKLDMQQAFWHCRLDEHSSKLTTFATPRGRYRWLRLPFGLNTSSEEFQRRLTQALGDLDGILCIADDILCIGMGDTWEQAIKDHHQKLCRLLHRCKELGIRLNKDKSDFCRSEVSFLGNLVTSDGLKADPKKIEAITKLQPPTCVEEIHRFSGMVNYLARFLPRLSEVIQPITKLTRKDQTWTWGKEQDRSFTEIKKLVTQAPILMYYDVNRPLTIQCDASEKGLGAVLLQDDKPVAYASRALRDAETRYAQIEKEMLAIVWSLERFDQYTFAKHTTVQSDHKPLEALMKKPLSKAPKRLQGMMMRLLRYDVEVRYRRGADMHLADMLSRAYLPETSTEQHEFEYVNATKHLPVTAERLKQIKEATNQDETLQTLRKVIIQGWPESKSAVPEALIVYHGMRDELIVQDGLIFKGERVVIPKHLRHDLKKSIHSSHLGVTGCLQRARECIYWPGMTTELKQYIASCETCRSLETTHTKETLMSHELVHRPWEKIGVDLMTLEGRDYLITVDYFSNFWEVDRLYSTDSKAVITKLKAHFARYGIPNIVFTDNGPQFSSFRFTEFATAYDFDHITSSPHHPKSNGKVESAVKAAKHMMMKTEAARSDPYLALLDIRNTPTQGLLSPVQRLMGRRARTLLPMTSQLLEPRGKDSNQHEIEKMKENQAKQAHYYNRHARDLPHLNEGDTVRMKPFELGKRTWDKGVVSSRVDARSYEILTDSNTTVRRNRVHLRRTPESSENSDAHGHDGLPSPNTVQEDLDTHSPDKEHSSSDVLNTAQPHAGDPPRDRLDSRPESGVEPTTQDNTEAQSLGEPRRSQRITKLKRDGNYVYF